MMDSNAIEEKVLEIAERLAAGSAEAAFPQSWRVVSESNALQSVAGFTFGYILPLNSETAVGVLCGLLLMGIEVGRCVFGAQAAEE
jgi:hypothetical protein